MVIYTSPLAGTSSDYEGRILVDETDYRLVDEKLPFEPKESVRIRAKEKFSKLYDCFDVIGEGKFGKVYRCQEKATGLVLAAKRIRIKRDADRKQVEKEVAIMTQMRHPRIAQIYDAFSTPDNDIILVMEVVPGGELFDRVVEESYLLTELAVVMITCQLCEAVDYIHKKHIVHLDIKPENIMCVSQTSNRIKLIDFGLAQYYDGSSNLLFMAGTPEFVAPEVVKFEPIDFHTDMWSIGVITYILLSGISPFLGDSLGETYCAVEKGEWEFDEECFEGISETAKDFISKLLVYDKSKRMLPETCLQHDWIVQARARTACESPICEPHEGKPISKESLRKYIRNQRFRRATWAVLFLMRFKKFGNLNWSMMNNLVEIDGTTHSKLSKLPSQNLKSIERENSVVQCDITLKKNIRYSRNKVIETDVETTNPSKSLERPSKLKIRNGRYSTNEHTAEVQKCHSSQDENYGFLYQANLAARHTKTLQEKQKCSFTYCRRNFKFEARRNARQISTKKVTVSMATKKLEKTIRLQKLPTYEFRLHSKTKNHSVSIVLRLPVKSFVSSCAKCHGRRASRSVKARPLSVTSTAKALVKATDCNNNAATVSRNSSQKSKATTAKVNSLTKKYEMLSSDKKENGFLSDKPAKSNLTELHTESRDKQQVNGDDALETLNEQNVSDAKILNDTGKRDAPKTSGDPIGKKGGNFLRQLQEEANKNPVLNPVKIRPRSALLSRELRPKPFNNYDLSSLELKPLAVATKSKPISNAEAPSHSYDENNVPQSGKKDASTSMRWKPDETITVCDNNCPSIDSSEETQLNVMVMTHEKMQRKVTPQRNGANDKVLNTEVAKKPIAANSPTENEKRSFNLEKVSVRKKQSKPTTAIKVESGSVEFSFRNTVADEAVTHKYICGCAGLRQLPLIMQTVQKIVKEPKPSSKRSLQRRTSPTLCNDKLNSPTTTERTGEKTPKMPLSGAVFDAKKQQLIDSNAAKDPKPKVAKKAVEDIAQFRLSNGKCNDGTEKNQKEDRLKPDRVEVRDEDYVIETATVRKERSQGLSSLGWLKNKLETRLKNRFEKEESTPKGKKSERSLDNLSNAQKALNMWKSIEKSNNVEPKIRQL